MRVYSFHGNETKKKDPSQNIYRINSDRRRRKSLTRTHPGDHAEKEENTEGKEIRDIYAPGAKEERRETAKQETPFFV